MVESPNNRTLEHEISAKMGICTLMTMIGIVDNNIAPYRTIECTFAVGAILGARAVLAAQIAKLS